MINSALLILYPNITMYEFKKQEETLFLSKKNVGDVLTNRLHLYLHYFLKIPNGFPTGKNSLSKCAFKTAAAQA